VGAGAISVVIVPKRASRNRSWYAAREASAARFCVSPS
jgi:hypothetical protein